MKFITVLTLSDWIVIILLGLLVGSLILMVICIYLADIWEGIKHWFKR